MYHNSKAAQSRWWKKWRRAGATPKPEFFFYYGRHSMCLNVEVMNSLTADTLVGLSKPELEFYQHWKENGLLDVHSGSCMEGAQPKQRELCKLLMEIFTTAHKKESIPLSQLI